MDTKLAAASQALAAFDPLAALKLVALRDEPEALALRGVAMAQLGDYAASQRLLTVASRALAPQGSLAWARCLAALGEVSLARRDLDAAGSALDAAGSALEAAGDLSNAMFVRLQHVRRLVLLGAIREAAAAHRALDLRAAPPRMRALAELVGADIAARALDPRSARAALVRARALAEAARVPSLKGEIERAEAELEAPVARALAAGSERHVTLDEVASILGSQALVVDACRRSVCEGDTVIRLVTRPVLLALAAALGAASPGAVAREALAEAAFGARRINESVRARLRVELGRLRREVSALATIDATLGGYALRPRRAVSVVVLLPPAPSEASALLALLRGGESWSTSALAAAMGTSQRTVQRALTMLREQGRVEGTGSGRSRRWVARPPEGFATTLLLVARAPRG